MEKKFPLLFLTLVISPMVASAEGAVTDRSEPAPPAQATATRELVTIKTEPPPPQTEKYENLASENDTLGLIFKYGTVKVAKDIERIKFGLSITAVRNIDKVKIELEKLQNELNKLAKIPAFSDATDHKHRKDVALVWGTVQTKIEILMTAINTLNEYQDLSTIDKQLPDCHLQLDPINVNLIKPLTEKVQMIISYTDLTATKQTYDQNKENFSSLLNNIELIDEKVSEVLLTIRERIDMLDALASNEINDHLFIELHKSNCLFVAAHEKINIDLCEKQASGMYCLLDVATFKATLDYEIYYSVNYEDIQLKSEANQIIARSPNNEFGYLTCHEKIKGTYVNPFDECHFMKGDPNCFKAIADKKIDDILRHCKFIRKKPEPVSRTRKGFLLQGKNITMAKEIDHRGRLINMLPNSLPIYLETVNRLLVQYDGFETTFSPTNKPLKRLLIKSWLTNEDIKKLEYWNTVYEMSSELGIGDYVDMIIIFIIVVSSPFFIAMCTKLIKTSDWYWNRAKQWQTKRRDEGKANFDKNKELVSILAQNTK